MRAAKQANAGNAERRMHGAEMKLPFKLDRPIVFFDLETTGLSLANDRIVELAIVKVSPNGDVLERERRYNPEMPIPPEAAVIHGITDADVAGEHPFRRRAKAVADMMMGCDLGGFNIRRFDLPVLMAEFKRAGVPFEIGGRRLVDMKMIFHREEPRDLSAAARFYLGRDHQDAHSAVGDIRTAVAVLSAQLDRYDLPRNMAGLHAYCDEIAPFKTGFDRWFKQEAGILVFDQGKHKATPLAGVAATDPDYLKWMLDEARDIDEEVKETVRAALRSR